MELSYITKLFCGISLISIPTIQFGGQFLLSILSGKRDNLELTVFQKSMFRAGHAHAGVLTILGIICQILTDYISVHIIFEWTIRIGVPTAALLISGGFFAGATGKNVTSPTRFIGLVYSGSAILAACLIMLGIGLIISK